MGIRHIKTARMSLTVSKMPCEIGREEISERGWVCEREREEKRREKKRKEEREGGREEGKERDRGSRDGGGRRAIIQHPASAGIRAHCISIRCRVLLKVTTRFMLSRLR
jgi:hypothetical protein